MKKLNYLTHVALEVNAGLCNFLSALKLEQVYHLGHGRVSVCDLAVCPRHNLLGPRGSCRVHELLKHFLPDPVQLRRACWDRCCCCDGHGCTRLLTVWIHWDRAKSIAVKTITCIPQKNRSRGSVRF